MFKRHVRTAADEFKISLRANKLDPVNDTAHVNFPQQPVSDF